MWWQQPGLSHVFEVLGEARSNRSPDIDTFLKHRGLAYGGYSGRTAVRTAKEVIRRAPSVTEVSDVHLSDGRLAVVDSNGTVFVTGKPVRELSAEEMKLFDHTSLFNATSPAFSSLEREIVEAGLEGVGLYAGDTYYVIPLDSKNHFRIKAYEKGKMRTAFYGGPATFIRDLKNVDGIRAAIADPQLQFRIYTAPVFPPDGPPSSGLSL